MCLSGIANKAERSELDEGILHQNGRCRKPTLHNKACSSKKEHVVRRRHPISLFIARRWLVVVDKAGVLAKSQGFYGRTLPIASFIYKNSEYL